MIRLIVGPLAVVGLLAACQNAPKTDGADSTNVAVTAETEGYYEVSLAAASSPGRLIGLTLSPGNEARMTTDYMNRTPEIVQMGKWTPLDSGKILVTLVTVGSGNPTKDSMHFRRDGDALIYVGEDYGSDGMSLTRKQAPAPAPKELVLWVKNEAECDRGPGFGKTTCYDVYYGDMLNASSDADWEKLMEPIEGFKFEKGNIYKLRVNRLPRDPRIQDVGAYTYQLLEVVSAEKKK
ncbi:DUF4377 domain-containing protein [Chitinophaga lutea]